MYYPYFKKASFHKVQQRIDGEEEETKNINYPHEDTAKPLQDLEDSIPEEGLTHYIKIESYRKASKFEKSNSACFSDMEDLDNIIEIKMPRALKVKNFNIEEECNNLNSGFKALGKENKQNHQQDKTKLELSKISEEIRTEDGEENKYNPTKTLSPKRNISFESSFYSIVFLPHFNEYCFCQLDESIFKLITVPLYLTDAAIKEIDESNIKIEPPNFSTSQIKLHTKGSYKSPETKVKCFVELNKYHLEIKIVNECTLSILILSKGVKEEGIEIVFKNYNERCTFECVYMSVIDALSFAKDKQTARTPIAKTNSEVLIKSSVGDEEVFDEDMREKSIDSLKFSVERIRYKKATSFLDNFDLILFKGKNIMCKMQRFFTNSEFDHVGLIMKTVNGDLLLLEATGNVGVAIYSFSSIEVALKKEFYDRIVVRKLSGTDSEGIIEKNRKLSALQEFVSKSNGKKYKFDPMYLLSSTMKTQKSELTKEEETYFCSELVAEALKVCGIMKTTKPSYQYLPSNFAFISEHFGDAEGLNEDINSGYFYSDPIVLEK